MLKPKSFNSAPDCFAKDAACSIGALPSSSAGGTLMS